MKENRRRHTGDKPRERSIRRTRSRTKGALWGIEIRLPKAPHKLQYALYRLYDLRNPIRICKYWLNFVEIITLYGVKYLQNNRRH